MQTNRYFQMMFPFFNTERTKQIFHINPTVTPVREEAANVHVCVYEYDSEQLEQFEFTNIDDVLSLPDTKKIRWINIDGLRKADVEKIARHFHVHYLIAEDILSVGQRPKMDEINDIMFALLNMLYFNTNTSAVELEQISIVLGKNFVITFQEDAGRDVFNGIREKLKIPTAKLRQSSADYLCYSLIDTIVDHYFVVMENLSDRIEQLEEDIIREADARSLGRINSLRKELIVLKRNVTPVRDLVTGFMRSDNPLLNEKTTKYFKDVYDHIVQAADMVESYRDMMMNMQDLYLNKANIKLNEAMKVMAIVTVLLAPATVIGGIFGMNFDRIPYLHNKYGFFIAVALMLLIPLWMIRAFKKRGWF